MKKTSKFTVKKRRRRECLTNYSKRINLLKSGKNRLVIRKSNKHIIAQVVQFDIIGDKILASVNSKELLKYGYNHSLSNIPAAYLSGLLLAKKCSAKKLGDLIVDIGLSPAVLGSRLFAVVKGCVDGGLKVRASEESFPDENRIKGHHISDYANKLKKEDPEKYNKIFSALLKKNVFPEKIEEDFEAVKKKIEGVEL